MALMNVAVLRGGPSREYDVSLATGAAVLANLSEDKYRAKDVLIARDGTWHTRGVPTTPDRALRDVDVAFIALHGEYGEDGTIQKILDAHGVPYTGSGAFGSAIAMDKGKTRELVGRLEGVRMPSYSVLYRDSVGDAYKGAAQQVFSKFGPAYIVKPLRGGSSIGILVAHSVAELVDALFEAFQDSDALIVEQFITGREATCGVVEQLRDQDLYSLPPIEIRVPIDKKLFDYDAKYDGQTEEICPANFTKIEKDTLERASRAVHKALNLRHYSRSDFILTTSGVYFLEVNTLPGLTPNSLLPKSVDAVGVLFGDFLDHLIMLARR